MENLKADNEKILNEAKTEREAMLKEAREMKSKLISDAENEAKAKAKSMVVDLSVGIAEKLISEELADKDKQLKMIEEILDDSKLK